MSLLLDRGHPDARSYPLGFLWDESNIVLERDNALLITQAMLQQQTIASILSKEGGKLLQKSIESLSLTTAPYEPVGPQEGIPDGERQP